MSRSVSSLVLVALLLAGCDTTVQPPIPNPPDSLAVYSVVTAGDSSQYAVVARPRAADERPLRYVQDATVEIAGRQLLVVPEDSISLGGFDPLTPPGESDANYVADSLSVQPGETVRLRVSTDTREMTGTVRVPGTFTGVVDSMTVRWRPSAGAQTYRVRVRRYDDIGDVEWEYVTTTDDTTTTISEESDQYGGSFQPGPHEVLVTAVDPNLAGYRDEGVRRSGVEGGFGFFGALTRIGGTVTLPATDDNERRKVSSRLRPRPDMTSTN